MRKILALVFVALAAPLVGVAAASADTGDGNETCNTYEICFFRNSDNVRYSRDFYYGDSDHSGNSWYDRQTNTWTSIRIEDDANRVKNRDGSCDVKVIDWNGALPSVSDTIPNDGVFHQLNDNVRNQNNEHQRVNC